MLPSLDFIVRDNQSIAVHIRYDVETNDTPYLIGKYSFFTEEELRESTDCTEIVVNGHIAKMIYVI